MTPGGQGGDPDATSEREVGGNGLIFILSAPSGAGKTTLCRALMDRFPEIAYSISSTTRPPRAGEIEGRDYHFVSRENFEAGIESGRWAEWARVHDYYYGTPAKALDDAIAAGRDLLLDIDVQGTRQILERYADSVTIFIMPPSIDVLAQRLAQRGTDDPATIQRRLSVAETEMAACGLYRHVIVNDRLPEAIDALVTVVGNCRRRRSTKGNDRA